MSLILNLQQIIQEEDGSFTVHLKVTRDLTDKVVAQKEFNVSNAAQLKLKVKPLFEALVANEIQRENIRSIAQATIDEIMVEVIQP